MRDTGVVALRLVRAALEGGTDLDRAVDDAIEEVGAHNLVGALAAQAAAVISLATTDRAELLERLEELVVTTHHEPEADLGDPP
jgi:hypothetical protein